MRAIEDNADPVALAYDELPEPAQATVGSVEASVAQLVVGVVCEQHYPEAGIVERLDAVEVEAHEVDEHAEAVEVDAVEVEAVEVEAVPMAPQKPLSPKELKKRLKEEAKLRKKEKKAKAKKK